MERKNNYGIDDIKSLSFKEGVRTRIQMYLGSADNEGTYQAFKEIINNATDEALCGYGNQINISVDEDNNTIEVQDYGRGVPFGIRENGENVLVSIYSKSHTGGKFEEGAYKNVSGLNGIGAKCVCLSSNDFVVESCRDGKMAKAIFFKGDLIDYHECPTKHANGTCVRFSPDPEVFKDEPIHYSFQRICEDIKNISYLYSGITFNLYDIKTGTRITHCAKNGIIDFVKDNLKDPIHPHIIHETITDGTDKLEIAFQWGSKHETSYVFVNGLRCPEGGSPITGAKMAITRTFNTLTGETYDGELIRANLFYVINCSVAQPSFANQTKTKINNANLRAMASTAFSNALKMMGKAYRDEFATVANLVKRVTKADAAAEKARKQALEATKDIERNQKRKVFQSDKLKDAEYLGPNSTLLIVEGNSAMGGMAQARDYKKYGILAIRGKIINCLSNSEEDIYQNEEIKLLLSAMNIIPGRYDASKLRYGKLGICVDADSDGYHIGLLIMSALTYLAPEFIKEGRLYWLRSPLWVVSTGKKRSYYFDDDEFNAVRGQIRGEIKRCKGLGTLEPEEAQESMFTDEFQRFEQMEYSPEAIDLLYDLMGTDIVPRRDFIFNNVDFTEVAE